MQLWCGASVLMILMCDQSTVKNTNYNGRWYTNKQTNKQTNNQQTNKQTNQPTNQPTNKQTNTLDATMSNDNDKPHQNFEVSVLEKQIMNVKSAMPWARTSTLRWFVRPAVFREFPSSYNTASTWNIQTELATKRIIIKSHVLPRNDSRDSTLLFQTLFH